MSSALSIFGDEQQRTGIAIAWCVLKHTAALARSMSSKQRAVSNAGSKGATPRNAAGQHQQARPVKWMTNPVPRLCCEARCKTAAGGKRGGAQATRSAVRGQQACIFRPYAFVSTILAYKRHILGDIDYILPDNTVPLWDWLHSTSVSCIKGDRRSERLAIEKRAPLLACCSNSVDAEVLVSPACC